MNKVIASLCRLPPVGLFLIALLFSPILQAEYLGLPDGRLAHLNTDSSMSVEAAIISGQLDNAEYEHQGVRLNVNLAPDVQLFGNIGSTTLSSPSGTSYGAGIFYELPGIFPRLHTAVKTAFNQVDVGETHRSRTTLSTIYNTHCNSFFPYNCTTLPIPDISTTTSTVDGNLSVTTIEFLFSGKNRFGPKNSIGWYGSTGVFSARGERADGTEITIGGGLVIPWTSGEFYTGLDLTRDLIFGLGLRYNIKYVILGLLQLLGYFSLNILVGHV